MIPILFNHDYTQLPVGYLEDDGTIKLRKESGITVEQLCNIGLGFTPKKIVDGVIIEAELHEISLVVKQ